MRYRKLTGFNEVTPNPAYDYIFGKGNPEWLVNSPAAVGQSVLTRLQLWTGEWFLDVTEGTPWLQSILSANIKDTVPLYDMAIKNRILTTRHVTGIENYASNLNTTTRRLVVSMLLNTEYGVFPLLTEVGVP